MGWKRAIKHVLYKPREMPVDDVWLTPVPSRASRLWSLSSLAVVSLITACSKVWIGWFNKPQVHRKHVLMDLVDNREDKRPLITTCNHYSMVDDPVLAYMLSWRQVWNLDNLRWLLGAKDVCNRTFTLSMFFQLGKVLPVVRGDGVYQHGMNYCVDRLDEGHDGVYQHGMNYCVDRLNEGQWVHIYPEGKINMQREIMRLKWGIGRLIADSKVCPVVLPYWHIGMENVLPTVKPYVLRPGNHVTVLIGDPIDFEDELKHLRSQQKSPEEIRKYLTDRVQDAFTDLKLESERLHSLRFKTKESS